MMDEMDLARHFPAEAVSPPYRTDSCPCPPFDALLAQQQQRRLEQDEESDTDPGADGKAWEIAYACVVLLLMFAALVTDRLGADSIMVAALAAFMAAEIVTVEEGLAGFANAGLWTVMVLFVVARGISLTGALDWYMGKLLGRPGTAAGAQLRLMVPIAVVSAFLNNTPIVVVMIPIVQRWAKSIRVSPQQLLIPLSFASILGGTCTLIGTSTNLVVVGLLNERYPNDPDVNINLFGLGRFGVPVAMAGIAYVLLASPWLLPGGRRRRADGVNPLDDELDDILLGARLTPWSPAAGRTVQRSGLRDTGGIFLVSVHRAATGNVHRAVSNDFVLNTGDVLYFTGFVESFGEFCEEHGLEMMTNEVEQQEAVPVQREPEPAEQTEAVPRLVEDSHNLPTVQEDEEKEASGDIPTDIGITKESLLLADEEERRRTIHRMTDMIRGVQPSDEALSSLTRPLTGLHRHASDTLRASDPAKIVVTIDRDLVVAGINARDRPGLLLDISRGLLRLNLELRHTEAAVVDDRSISIWRCEGVDGTELPDLEEIWSVLNALLSNEAGIEAVKQRGLRVIRARVVKDSRLVGKTAAEVSFRRAYRAAIVAVGHSGKTTTTALSTVRFEAGDVLVLQASDDSPLLKKPPEDFYKNLKDTVKEEKETSGGAMSRTSSVGSFLRTMTGRKSFSEDLNDADGETHDPARSADDDSGGGEGYFLPSDEDADLEQNVDREAVAIDMSATLGTTELAKREEAVWRDLQVLFKEEGAIASEGATREFLTAMEVAPHSKLAGRNVAQIGINKMPDLFLVSIDRPLPKEEEAPGSPRRKRAIPITGETHSISESSGQGTTVRTERVFTTIEPEEPLQAGDVLWFSGPASAVGDLRKIPGLISYEADEVKKINTKVHDRRLVQAVVARNGPLVGKTVKDVRFRTRYGAAVIAVHREGKRVHEHPGQVKLHPGDVLLLEAGPSFIAKSADNDRSFALLAEVEDSAPPRLRLLIPALLIAAGMLIVFMAGVTSLLISALVASILMVVLGILSEQEARDALNWEIYLTIAAAFGIGTALVNSGVAGAVADFLVSIGTAIGIGDAGLLGAVYFATFLISNVVTNNAAAALLFPIAMDAAEQTGTDRIIMSYALMLGASASFMVSSADRTAIQ
jgi:di/tricarboxylate transporter